MANRPKDTTPAIKIGEVEDGIPLPISALSRGHRYPLDKLTKPGMSFFVSGGRPSSVTSAVYDAARAGGIKVRCLTVVENDIAGIRVWRMADDWQRGTKAGAKAAREPKP